METIELSKAHPEAERAALSDVRCGTILHLHRTEDGYITRTVKYVVVTGPDKHGVIKTIPLEEAGRYSVAEILSGTLEGEERLLVYMGVRVRRSLLQPKYLYCTVEGQIS